VPSGITPAPAGSTRRFLLPRARGRDHPRACGEHDCKRLGIEVTWGSPPRLRGAQFRPFAALTHMRITPAPAGSTTSAKVFSFPPKDHPRACGEHEPTVWRLSINIGSPPRLRGAPCREYTINVYCGITPAPAGSTLAKRRCDCY